MAWREITEDDVYATLSDAEATALRAADLRPGQEEPMAVVLRQVTGYARDAIRSHADNRLAPDAALVPEACVPACVDMAVVRMGLRLSRSLKITEERKDAARAAERYFRSIAKGEMAVEQYGAEPDETEPVPAPRVTGRDRNFTRETQDGI